MPIILGYPLINWYIGLVFLVLFCLFIRIHIIEPRGPAQGGITKGIIPTNEPDNEIIWNEIFKLDNNIISINFFNYLRNILGDIFLCVTPMFLIYQIAKMFINKNEFSLTDKKIFAANTLINISIFFLIFAIIAYVCLAYRYDMINTILKIDLYNNLYTLDLYSISIKLMILLTSIFILHNSRKYILLHSHQMLEFTVLLTLAVFFLSILVSSNDLMVMFISIIGFSLNMYVLLMSDFDRRASLEAGIKYFYLSAFSSGLLISGIWLSYIIFFSTHFTDIRLILDNWLHLPGNLIVANQGILQIMIYSIVYGFLFKLAAFPCHLWAPEVYEGSPNPIMAFFILPVKIAIFAIFIRLVTNVFKDIYNLTSYIIWFSSWTSMLWGCYGAFTELKLRKFIAFSSINQMGFLLIGVACGTFVGIRATLIYLFIYVVMNCGFLQIFLTTYADKDNLTLDFVTDFKYFARDNKVFAILLIIILFSMAGIPPLAGFFGKYFLFAASVKSGYYFLVIIGMLTSLISTFYYIRIIKIMWFDDHTSILPTIKFINIMDRVGRVTYFALSVFLVLFILFINITFNIANLITISCLILLIAKTVHINLMNKIIKIFNICKTLSDHIFFYLTQKSFWAILKAERFLKLFLNSMKSYVLIIKKKVINQLNCENLPKGFFNCIVLFYLFRKNPYSSYQEWIHEYIKYEQNVDKKMFFERVCYSYFDGKLDKFVKFWKALDIPLWEKYSKQDCINRVHDLIGIVYPEYISLKKKEEKNWKSLYEDHREFEDLITFLSKKYSYFSDPDYWIKMGNSILDQHAHWLEYFVWGPDAAIPYYKEQQETYFVLVKMYNEGPKELKHLCEEWHYIPKAQNLTWFWQQFNDNYWLLVYLAIVLAVFFWLVFIVRKVVKIDNDIKMNLIWETILTGSLILYILEQYLPNYLEYSFPFIIYLPFIWLGISLLLFTFDGIGIIQLNPIVLKFDIIVRQIIYYIWRVFCWICNCIWNIIRTFFYYLDPD